MEVLNLTRQTRLARVRVANSFFSRLIGLLGRKSLEVDEGLWIKPCRGMHTVGMRFSLDVVFLDAQNRAIKVVTGLTPFRICWGGREAKSVLELTVGTIGRSHTRPGDRIDLIEDA